MSLTLYTTCLLLVSACFHPNYNHPACGPNGECPNGLSCNEQLVCEGSSLDAPLPDDAAIGDASVDGPAPCVRGFLDLCSQAAPSIPTLDITDAQSINTDTDIRCRKLTQGGGGSDVCLIYLASVHVAATGSITATGKRPLAIASSSTMMIDGTIDVASHAGGQRGPAADTAGCTFVRAPNNDLGGGGGGAGGSFTLPGGDGGTGDNDNSANPAGTATPGMHGPTATIFVLRGGCVGQTGGDEAAGGGGNGGSGGHSGGALYLFARQNLVITGTIRATGTGGGGGDVQAGGGGGGTGGLVIIESPSITISGQISANGGGGGQGGGRLNGNNILGNPGTDGAMGTTAAAGGSGAAGGEVRLGFGGAGGAITAAISGTAADFGGGGGGGAAGVIQLLGAQQQLSGATISPAPTP